MAKESLILCFDGTGNEPGDSRDDERLFGLLGTEDASISNIFKLHLLLGGDLADGQAIEGQRSYYYSGIGTYGSKVRRVFNQALSPANKDVGRIISAAVEDLAQWERDHPGVDYELSLFGFSRGAAIARRFAAKLHEFDALQRASRVRFIGVFDTVASIGKPNLDDDTKPISDVVFENGTLSAHVDEALHLLSLDEQRIAFQPVLMNKDDRVTEVWFPGVHSDVGGGFRFDGLADIALQFLLDELDRRHLGLQITDPMSVPCEEINAQSQDCDLDLADLIIQPDPLGKMHPKKRPPIMTRITLASREPRINIDDKPSQDEADLPIVHASAIERIHADREYRPKALRRAHKVLYPYGAPHLDPIMTWQGLDEHLVVGERMAKPLEVGKAQMTRVYANRKYNRSGVLLRAGEKYVFEIPAGQVWYDASIDCNETGWDRDTEELGILELFVKLKEGQRRHPTAKWFEMIATVGRSDQALARVIEHTKDGEPFAPRQEGELHFFANDLDKRYGNNRGFISIYVTRVG